MLRPAVKTYSSGDIPRHLRKAWVSRVVILVSCGFVIGFGFWSNWAGIFLFLLGLNVGCLLANEYMLLNQMNEETLRRLIAKTMEEKS